MRARWAAVALVLATALTGCGGSDDSQADQPGATSPATGTSSPTASDSTDSPEPASLS